MKFDPGEAVPETVSCPRCHCVLQVPEEHRGRAVQCSKCQMVFSSSLATDITALPPKSEIAPDSSAVQPGPPPGQRPAALCPAHSAVLGPALLSSRDARLDLVFQRTGHMADREGIGRRPFHCSYRRQFDHLRTRHLSYHRRLFDEELAISDRRAARAHRFRRDLLRCDAARWPDFVGRTFVRRAGRNLGRKAEPRIDSA